VNKMMKRVLTMLVLASVVGMALSARKPNKSDNVCPVGEDLKINSTCLSDCFNNLKNYDEFPIEFKAKHGKIVTWAQIIQMLCDKYNARFNLVTPNKMIGIENVQVKDGSKTPISLCSLVRLKHLTRHGAFTFNIVQNGIPASLPGLENFKINTTCLNDPKDHLKKGESFVVEISTNSPNNEISMAHLIGAFCAAYNHKFGLVKLEDKITIDQIKFKETLCSKTTFNELRKKGAEPLEIKSCSVYVE